MIQKKQMTKNCGEKEIKQKRPKMEKKHGTIHHSLSPGNPLPQPRMTAWKMDFKVVADFFYLEKQVLTKSEATSDGEVSCKKLKLDTPSSAA